MDALQANTSDNLRRVYAGTDLSFQRGADRLFFYTGINDAELGQAEPIEGEIELSLEQSAPLFQSVQIPVLIAQRIRHRSDFRKLILQYPCHLRGPEGSGLGIAVDNRIDAIAACQMLMSRKVNGAFPKYLLVEGDYSSKRQLSLSMDWNEQSGEVTLRAGKAGALEQNGASAQGGATDSIVETTQAIRPDSFSSENGPSWTHSLGLHRSEQEGLTHLLEKLYILMTWARLTRCCLDSLIFGQTGEAIAVRGRLTFGASSPLRQQAAAAQQSGEVIHPEQLSCRGPQAGDPKTRAPKATRRSSGARASFEAIETEPAQGLRITQKAGSDTLSGDRFLLPRVVRLGEGNIAVVSNGFSRTMATLDQFQLHGGDSAAAFVSLSEADGGENGSGPGASRQQHQLCRALQALARLPKIKVILINWRSAHSPCRVVADSLVEYKRRLAQQGRRSALPLSLVVRLVGEDAEAGRQRLQGEEIAVEESLSGAIACSVGLARIGHS